MLCIGAREKNKIKLLWSCFWPDGEKENCGRGDRGGDWRYDVKMPNGENYVWVGKQKKAQWFFCGATALPLCWWCQRAPYGPIIIWTQVWSEPTWKREIVDACACDMLGLMFTNPSAWTRVTNGHWLQGQASVDWHHTMSAALWAQMRDMSRITRDVMENNLCNKRKSTALRVYVGMVHFIFNRHEE